MEALGGASEKMRIASFDCGVKTLAYVVVDINRNVTTAFKKGVMTPGTNIGASITQRGGEIIDITSGKKAGEFRVVDRIRLLLEALDARKNNFRGVETVLIEDQPPTNVMAREVMSVIIAYFLPSAHVETVFAINKNRVAFAPELAIDHFKRKGFSAYHANKNQSINNYAWFIKETEKRKFRKKDLCNIADAFMQVLGWFLYQ